MAVRSEPNSEPIPGYRLLSRLGSGGFGEVWKAEAPGGLLKAIKLVHGKISHTKSDDPNNMSQVDRELKGLERVKGIRHPFLLSMERYDIVDDRLIIVTELADRDLADRFKQCQKEGLLGIPRPELLGYLRETAEALDAMNFEHDVQHLDIKPSNVFLVGRHVKVADFGLAKALEGVSANVTSGMTPTYAAPETFNGWATRFTDQYSLAVMYQELATGKLPHPGPGAPQFMLQHLTKEPDLSPLTDAERPILRKALLKDPDKRYATCSEFIDELVNAVAAQGQIRSRAADLTPSSGPAVYSPAADGSARVHTGGEAAAPLTVIAGGPGSNTIRTPATGVVIGIDLGTSNSVVAIVEGNTPKVIVNQEGNRLTPSVVAFDGDVRVVGEPAKRQAITNPRRTISSIKRFMGRRHSEVESEEKLVTYSIVGGPEELVRVKIDDKDFTPPEISAQILRKLKSAAEEHLGMPVAQAVVTVPAYFNDSQRQATKEAGYIAGLEVKRILNEPTAAALAYGIECKKNQRIAVFDLGGGTFDITVLRVHEGVFDVLATNGDTHLGGDDFNAALVEHFAKQFQEQNGFDPRTEPTALQRLFEAAEKAKIELSSQPKTDINLPFLAADAGGPRHLTTAVTRAQFEQMTDALLQRCRGPCQQALDDAKLRPTEIDEVILVGGSTRMPFVRRFAKEFFGKEPFKGVNPDEAIAVGAALQGSMLAGKMTENLLLDVTPLSLGVEAKGGIMAAVIERNTTIPTIRKEVFTTARDGQSEVGIHILQGERKFAKDNRSLGRFWLGGIKPAPVGVPQIEVSFHIDADGILHVGAKDLSSGNEQSLTVKSNSGLSREEVERMRSDADQYASDDQKRRDLLDVKASSEVAIQDAEKFINANHWLPHPEKDKIQKAIAGLKGAMADQKDPLTVTTAVWQVQQAVRSAAQLAADRAVAKH